MHPKSAPKQPAKSQPHGVCSVGNPHQQAQLLHYSMTDKAVKSLLRQFAYPSPPVILSLTNINERLTDVNAGALHASLSHTNMCGMSLWWTSVTNVGSSLQ